jgi:hypothetical protein
MRLLPNKFMRLNTTCCSLSLLTSWLLLLLLTSLVLQDRERIRQHAAVLPNSSVQETGKTYSQQRLGLFGDNQILTATQPHLQTQQKPQQSQHLWLLLCFLLLLLTLGLSLCLLLWLLSWLLPCLLVYLLLQYVCCCVCSCFAAMA